MTTALNQISYDKSSGVDYMQDKLFHKIGKNAAEKAQLTKKVQDLINDEYWPSYMFKARIIPLSKNN